MKTNMMKIVRGLSLTCSLLFLGVGLTQAQLLEKTYINIIDVSQDAQIYVNGPKNFNMEGHGNMSISSENDKYVIKGISMKPIVKIDQDFQVMTWDDKKVKQVLEIKIEAAEAGKSQELLTKLNPVLEENAAGIVYVNCNLNIEKLELVNGMFRKDRTTLKFKDGSSYDIKKLELKATVYVPNTNDLELSVKFVAISLGDHFGNVKIDNLNGGFNAQKLNHLEAELQFASMHLNEVKQVKFKSDNSNVSIKNVDHLKGTSTFSKLTLGKINQLDLTYSASDKFTIKKVNNINVPDATFSDFQITTLVKKMDANLTSGDIVIHTIKAGFESIKLNNVFSTINLGVEETENYIIATHNNSYTSYDYPDGLLTIPNKENFSEYTLKGDQDKAGKIEVKCESCKVIYDY